MPEKRQSETQIQYHRRRIEELKKVRQPWETTWRSLAEFLYPPRLRLEAIDEGSVSRRHILEPTGTYALRTLASGMHSGLTSPARPWFRLNTPDPDMREWGAVKLWVDEGENVLRRLFATSNIYTAFHAGYSDLGQFGQSCGILVEGERDALRMIQLLHGRFWIARDGTGRATTLYRTFRWSVDRIVRRFGVDRLPSFIRTQYDGGNYDRTFDLWHAIEPRFNRDRSKLDRRNKPFLSNYWVDQGGGGPDDQLLEESGFDRNPIICPPWLLCGDDNYAQSPAMDALADVKTLQAMQRDKLEAIAKIVKPPMQGPTSLLNNPSSLLPGAMIYVDDPSGQGVRPTLQINLRIAELTAEISETRELIKSGMYADLFLMLANMEGVQPRNTMEIAERKEEKLLALGPVLENVYNNQLEPVIDIAFAIAARRGELPPAPPEIQGRPLSVEYISTLAQAQKAVATGAVERLVGFAGQIAGIKPEVFDKIDTDQAIDDYANMIGAPASMVVSDDKVEATRQARAKEQQMAQQAELAKTAAPAISAGAQAAQVASEAMNNPGGQNLLSRLGIG